MDRYATAAPLDCLNVPICLWIRYYSHERLQCPLEGGTDSVGNLCCRRSSTSGFMSGKLPASGCAHFTDNFRTLVIHVKLIDPYKNEHSQDNANVFFTFCKKHGTTVKESSVMILKEFTRSKFNHRSKYYNRAS